MSDWINIIEGDYSTYPNEGEEVLVSDVNNNYDVAYFLMSGEYKWVKVHVANDDISDFDSFNPIKWKQIK
jgi:hypothetical protein